MPQHMVPLYHGASGEFYQGVVTVTDTGKEYTCDLCEDTTCLGLAEWQAHAASHKHETRVVETRDLLRRHFQLRDLARSKCPQILQLKHTPWQDAAFAKMGRVLVLDEAPELITNDIDTLLVELELLESISVLELAVWKALCCANCPSTINSYFGFQAWLKEGWKSKKHEYRRCGQVVAIMKSVMPFVDQSVSANSQKVTTSTSTSSKAATPKNNNKTTPPSPKVATDRMKQLSMSQPYQKTPHASVASFPDLM